MTAVRETIKDYQDEVNDILSDRQLAAEIMYDLDQVRTISSGLLITYQSRRNGNLQHCHQMRIEAEQTRRASQSPRGIASSSPRVSNGSARLSMTPAKVS